MKRDAAKALHGCSVTVKREKPEAVGLLVVGTEDADHPSDSITDPSSKQAKHATDAAAVEKPTSPVALAVDGSVASALTAATSCVVKEERDGGWPAEFQRLRQLPFDKAEFARLHGWFYNSRRPDSIENRVAKWPRLHRTVLQMVQANELAPALGHLRCLGLYLEKTHHASVPRIMRGDAATAEAPSGGGTEVSATTAGTVVLLPFSRTLLCVSGRDGERMH